MKYKQSISVKGQRSVSLMGGEIRTQRPFLTVSINDLANGSEVVK